MTDSPETTELQFPRESHRTTDETFSWSEVKAIMDREIMRRAEYVTTIIRAMKDRFGEEALQVAAEAIYQIGYRKGKARAELVRSQGKENDLASLSELIAHKLARLYLGTTTELAGKELVVRETYCPLPVYWKAAGLSDDETLQLCRIFDQVDQGMIEGYNPAFQAELGGAAELARLGYCQMVIRHRVDKEERDASGPPAGL